MSSRGSAWPSRSTLRSADLDWHAFWLAWSSREADPIWSSGDNGPEFAGKTLDAWAYQAGVKIHFIRPGKPVENGYIERFNGKFRDECLNNHWLLDLDDAKATIEAWRRDYNEVRPHSSLGDLTPKKYSSTLGLVA